MELEYLRKFPKNTNINTLIVSTIGISLAKNFSYISSLYIRKYSIDSLKITIPISIIYLKNIKILEISNFYIKYKTIQLLSKLKNLEQLYIDDNDIIIDKNVFLFEKFKNLKILRISDNWIHDINGDSIKLYLDPYIGEKLPRLEKLFLDANGLKGKIPSSIGKMKNLMYLCLENNFFEGNVPYELGNLEKLISINLNRNCLKGKIPLSFKKLINLRQMRLENTKIIINDNEITILKQFIKNLESISYESDGKYKRICFPVFNDISH